MHKRYNNKKGFSMLEIVIMVALVAVAFVGIVKIMNKTTQLRYLTRYDFVAQGLAKEGIEIAEQLRNDNIENTNPFWINLFFLPPIDNDQRIIRLDYNGAASIATVAGADDVNATMKFDNTYFYQYTTGSASLFGRALTLTYQDDANTNTAYIQVKSDVYWKAQGDGHTYTNEAKIYDTKN